MMYLRGEELRARIGGGLPLRVAIIGGLTLAAFLVIFFRLWYLQVLSGDRYLAEANDNRIREIRVRAPRGEVLDRFGRTLVGNRTSLALQVSPTDLPADLEARERELAALAEASGLSLRFIRREMRRELAMAPAVPVTLRQDASYGLVYFLQENQSRFPGVKVEPVFVRRYPRGAVGAHLFGNVGEISEEQISEPRYRGVEPGDQIGQSGIEYAYDSYLRGRAGATRIQVDSLGNPKGDLSVIQPAAGKNVRLTIDAEVQASGDAALLERGLPGAFVAMDARDGQILGMGSTPTFDPAIFTRPISDRLYARLTDEDRGAALFNRAIQGAYPVGSTFKPITALAALAAGVITPTTTIVDDGEYVIGDLVLGNAGGVSNGTIALPRALEVSSDVFFYELGEKLDRPGVAEGGQLQRWAENLGLGSLTGIDIPAEAEGLVPTPGWRNELFEEGLTDRPWSVGDNVNLSIGQGDVQVTPLQLAVAYAALGNGGTLVRPHLGMQVEDQIGRVLEEIKPGPRRTIEINETHRQAILDGLHDAAQAPDGTAYGSLGGFPIDVCGKTGTAERGDDRDQAWFVAMAPCGGRVPPKIVVVVTIEEGGFGADSAAPAATEILSEYFDAVPRPVNDQGGNLE